MKRKPSSSPAPGFTAAAYSEAWQSATAPRQRFSARTLQNYAAAAIARRPFSARVMKAQDGTADVTEMLLYDEIGYWGVTAKDFVLALAAIGDGPITLRINSPGGDVFDGYAIYNALKARTAPVNVVVDGIAASAASFIAMAGASVAMGEASMLMIHNAWGFCMGDRRDMSGMADVLGKIDGQITAIYAAKAGADPAIFAAAMDAETWYTASEAKDAGLCDVLIAPETAGPVDPAAENSLVFSLQARIRAGRKISASLPDYDPDGDGDNDAQQALDCVNMAMSHLSNAVDCLNGGGESESNRALRRPAAAATTPEWQCSADQDLPIDADGAWDGPAAQERMLDAAGFNGDSPDPAIAKRGFLAWDHHNPKLKGSYKLPFADRIDGKLTSLKSGLDAAASRLPDTEIPDPIKTSARSVIDHYETRMKPAGDDAANWLRTMRNRWRVAEAEASA